MITLFGIPPAADHAERGLLHVGWFAADCAMDLACHSIWAWLLLLGVGLSYWLFRKPAGSEVAQ